MTLCLSQGFVFSAHIVSKSQLAVGDFALGFYLSERPSCDGFTEEHTILLVQICEVTERNSVSGTRKISSHTFG